MKAVERWHSDRLGQHVGLVRWGTVGAPVLVFPTAGGDAEEIERFGLVDALGGLMAQGRVKVYSIDSLNGRAWLTGAGPGHSSWLQHRYAEMIDQEVIAAIRADCREPTIEIVAAGPSIGAFNAVSAVVRRPDAFRAAICMSGTYDLSGRLEGTWPEDFYLSSPLHFLPHHPEGPHLDLLRSRFVLLAHGSGAWEDPDESRRMAEVLGGRGIPNRVDDWGWDHPHDWGTWQAMLPHYLSQLT
jgi:esterase/lipase superfamily enzyme